ncbi:hypothetical protein Ddye_013933 [Dipteronia dyeriana]|uniref:Reverse transcriptase domain-containing protein n=1 Tax=Dipteronia dyeriana TaxID=168575 RepID=A0AAD9X7C7_9ROSI|nr:hypothetical protein Ddye_013933 [Dipteronia dyeriana]
MMLATSSLKKKEPKAKGISSKMHGMITRRDKNMDVKWNLDVEIMKMVEKGVKLGFDFKSEQKTQLSKGNWNLEEEISKVIEKGSALGFDFNSIVDEMVDQLILSWNVRGLGRGEKRKAVRDLVSFHKPMMLFIQVSKLNSFDNSTIVSLGGSVLMKGVGVEAVGSAGGLISLWDENLFKLEEEFSYEEVWEAISSCDGNKAPGPDGLNLNFIKSNWDIIREDFLAFLKEFHKDCKIVKHLNRTYTALIPKIRKPECIADFRPISLVSSLYKVLSKVLTNRLKNVMSSIIGETQLVFMRQRQIIDSFVIANEIIHK